MTRSWREIETLLLAMVAAVPLYFTQAINPLPLIVFHAVMAGIAIRVWMGRGPELIPAPLMKIVALAFVFFYPVDAIFISRSAIAASTHLVLFIAVYQPIESLRSYNQAQRLLTTALIFVASMATSTHISVLLFVIVFAFLMLRQLMYISHMETVRSIGSPYREAGSGRAALFYLVGTSLIGLLLFPVLPRVRNPIVKGITGELTNASTGISDSIDFNHARSISPDPIVVARIWMPREAIPFFAPVRLRGAVYTRFVDNEWRQAEGHLFLPMHDRGGSFRIARSSGVSARVSVQQRFVFGNRLLLPVGTYEVSGLPQVFEGPKPDVYTLWQPRSDLLSYEVRVSNELLPLRAREPRVCNYPVTPPVLAMARRIVGDATEPAKQARRVENWLSTHFRYIPDPSKIGHTMTVDDFLLRERRGHCEYFAAGMVALMTAIDVPARIVGGFYGGKLNPLTGYFVIRREDAHAWVEVWTGERWETFDPTPPDLRPGSAQGNLVNVYASAISDSVNYFWDRYVLTFGLGDQIAILATMIAVVRDTWNNLHQTVVSATRAALAPVAIALGLIIAALLSVVLARRLRRPLFDQLASVLRRLGIEVTPGMTAEEAVAKLRQSNAVAAEEIEEIVRLYEEERFSGSHSRHRERELRRRIEELQG